MSTYLDEKLARPRSDSSTRPRATLRQLRNRYRGPQEKWAEPPVLLVISDAMDPTKSETWKAVAGVAGEDTLYELIEVRTAEEPR